MSIERGDTIEWETVGDRFRKKGRIYSGVVNKVDNEKIFVEDKIIWKVDPIYIRITKKRNSGA